MIAKTTEQNLEQNEHRLLTASNTIYVCFIKRR